ncbi:MAG: chromosome segregation protein SMC [Gammaproteobacteria bacterium]|nr:chromosome segregation protein SMC [Gammaproteobacteria bacterium]
MIYAGRMRITKIKLAGFKSFVDPTTLHLPGNLTGVVGPNGCGKSNIIDAMMWVMGESSAKHLRGDSMADVIFSGSSTRKPVGQASVELIFDNADGALGGAYASFAEISIKRTVTRDGISAYFLNGGRCRRKDIIDIFLGTGLGARGGYSVIEQGMISRVIEAKPEELRGFLEEAAGISKYKERRRETENRIRHTNENLARVNDVRDELEKQLGHLQRQARAAEKYQEFKAEERRLEAELIAIRWRKVERDRLAQQALTAERETAVEAALAELRAVESRQAELRVAQGQALDAFNARQSDFYAKSAEVSRLEQTLQYNEDRRKSLEQDLMRARASLEETLRLHGEDETRLTTVTAEIEALVPEEQTRAATEDEAAEALRRIEEGAEAWQQEWDQFNREQAETARLEHAEQVRLELLQSGFSEARQRARVLTEEQAQLAGSDVEMAIEALESELAEREARYDVMTGEQQHVRSELQTARLAQEDHTRTLHRLRGELQQLMGQEASLAALQEAALGRDAKALHGWLENHRLRDTEVLAGHLHIEQGWELAVEVALRLPLSSLCEPGMVERLAGTPANDLPVVRLGGLEPARTINPSPSRADMPTRLFDRVHSQWSLAPLLAGVYCCATMEEAMTVRARLEAHESVITPQGVWLGPNWIQLPGRETIEAGVLARQRSLEELAARIVALREEIEHVEDALARAQQALQQAEQRERELTTTLQGEFTQIGGCRNQLALRHGERTRLEERHQAISRELDQLAEQAAQNESTLSGLREQVEVLRERLSGLTERGEDLNQRRREVQAQLENARLAWRGAREARHAVALKLEGLRSTHHSLGQALARNARLVHELQGRCTDLERVLGEATEPQEDLGAQLNRALGERITLEEAMKASRGELESTEASLRETDERQLVAGREITARQQALEQVRLEERALQVRTQELMERLEQQGQVLSEVLAQLADEAAEEPWRERLESTITRINRLGPINLAAIDEFAQLSERKTYLDNQLADLNQALETLQDAMHKIDKETRTRFRETFDKVNEGMQRLFPVLFGGGHASLELTNEDLLETGVSVMARPPGKRNTTIHLLSGGEKALTALSFVFSLFELNPAPFCLLDEVDAPLDDANVVRLSELLKSMADRVQFLFISHNKITMEIAQQLIGVTMHEAGVSRLVAVNMEEAVALAHSA